MRLHKSMWAVITLNVIFVLGGCSDPGAAITTDMHEDFDHDHKHQHTGKGDHEHEHDDGFRGSHTHGHTHSHRHGTPIHGGRIVSIGHTHHEEGATHFHAEVIPLSENELCFHLLTESDAGVSKDFPIEVKEITALISVQGQESAARECQFVGQGGGQGFSRFCLTIPEDLRDADGYAVVIPKIKLGGQRQNFSFSQSRSDQADASPTAAEAAAESPQDDSHE